MSSLDDMLAGMDAWNKGEVYKKPVSKPAIKPAAKPPATPSPSPPEKKVLKKRKIDQHFEKIEVPEAEKEEKNKKAKAYMDALFKKTPIVQKELAQLGDEPLVITAQQCELAVQEIITGNHKIIAVDCEGVNLGRNGRLCLVQVATPKKAYLFDIIEGGPGIFDSGLRTILEDATITKVMHDCRLDSDALFHEHKVNLANVFDTQVAFAVVTRGKGFSTPLPVGLNTVLKIYAHGAANEVKDHMKQAMQSDPEYWLKRPMDENALKYARQDVTFLCTVQRQMDALLSVMSRKNVVHFSNFYLDQYRKLEEAIVRESKEGTTERFVPKYGIKEWDMDCALNLERNAGRKRK